MDKSPGDAHRYEHGQQDQQEHQNPRWPSLRIRVASIAAIHICQSTPPAWDLFSAKIATPAEEGVSNQSKGFKLGDGSGAQGGTMADEIRFEKFPVAELAGLRTELLQAGMDSWQAAELVTTFLSGRGYGADPQVVRELVQRLEGHSSLEFMQQELERAAYVM